MKDRARVVYVTTEEMRKIDDIAIREFQVEESGFTLSNHAWRVC
jgi:hypothetical protein